MKNIYSILMISFLVIIGLTSCNSGKVKKPQPVLGNRSVAIIENHGLKFKDLNKNGSLDPYEDWRLPADARIANLVSMMTLEEKVGLMFHPNIAVKEDGVVKYDLTEEEKAAAANASEAAYAGPIMPDGQPQTNPPSPGARPPQGQTGPPPGMAFGQMRSTATAKSYIEEKNFRNILNNGVAPPVALANWSNGMQEIAENSRLGIPIMFSTDPRHGAILGAHVRGKQYFSQWTSKEGQFGLAASRDTVLVREFGSVVAEEYRAVGLHMILGPQIDVVTEPRWGRNAGCFSESAELTAVMIKTFLEGAQGKNVGPTKILAQIKHWPGSGPHLGGQGQQLVYPGNNFQYHLLPWKAAFKSGAMAVMGYYSGTSLNGDNGLGVNYSEYIMTTVLRDSMKFEGVVCTDWGVISRTGPLREDIKDMPKKDRYKMSIEAGVDQFGSETDPETIVALVKEGKVSEDRINLAAKRILKWHFALGLFENPYVDAEAAGKIVQSEKNQKEGYDAQLKSIVLLTNDGTLPFKNGDKKNNLYVFGIDTAIANQYGNVVSDPRKADLAVIRVSTALERGFMGFGGPATEVNIDFPKESLEAIKKVTSTGVPTIAVLNLGGSLVVLPQELLNVTKSTLMVFDILDNPLLDVIFGKFNPTGKLPFDLPSSMYAVRNQMEDVPFDTENPLFKYGFGLSY